MKRKSIFTCIEFLVAIVMVMLICFLVVAPAIAQHPSSNSPIPSPIPNPAFEGLIRVKNATATPATGVVPKNGWTMQWTTVDGSGNIIFNYRTPAGVTKQVKTADLAVFGALTPTNGDIIQRVSGAWANRTLSQLKTAMDLYTSDIPAAGDYQYLSAAQKVLATQTATTARTGLLSYTDWNTFNGKQDALGFTAVPNTRTVGGNALSSDITNSQLKTSVLAATLYSDELTPANDAQFLSAAQKAVVVGNTGTIKGGSVTVTSGDVSGGSTTITTGLSTIASMNIKTLRANVSQYSETITISGGSIAVAGGSGYTLTENDVIYWIAVGGL